MVTEDFAEIFFEEIKLDAVAKSILVPESFFEIYTNEIAELGNFETAEYCHHEKLGSAGRGGIRIDGYGGDPIDSNDSSLILFISDIEQSKNAVSINQTEMNSNFGKIERFLEMVFNQQSVDSLDLSDPVYDLCKLIQERWEEISKINLYLLSNKKLNVRIDRIEDKEFKDKKISYNVWDLNRFEHIWKSSDAQEDMVVNFEDIGGSLPTLKASIVENKSYQSYLGIINGFQLSHLYDEFGDKILRENVRVFLQSTAKVNRGIRNSILNTPDMFFAYNNGITATVEDLKFDKEGKISEVKNIQIVNGGQTMGSLYQAKIGKTPLLRHIDDEYLSDIFIQIKISLIKNKEEYENIVSDISRFANRQNSINDADLSSNHPFLRWFEGISARTASPQLPGSLTTTKWFFERARGQYRQQKSIRSGAELRKFVIEIPSTQVIKKTDLAKFLNVWEDIPHTVSRGATRQYSVFMNKIENTWSPENQKKIYNDLYYKESIAKAIVFKTTEKIVSESEWYEAGGPRAQIVNYAISKISYDIKNLKSHMNFIKIWENQELSQETVKAIALSAKICSEIIFNPPKRGQLYGEWAKDKNCWEKVKEIKIQWPESFKNELHDKEEHLAIIRTGAKDGKEVQIVQIQSGVMESGEEFWNNIKQWGTENNLLSPHESNTISNMINLLSGRSQKIPSDNEFREVVGVVIRLNYEGCPHTFPDNVKSRLGLS